MMNFKKWAPLKFVDSDLLNQVKLAYVFGKTGQEAFLITENDEVFACGPNYSNCLGLGQNAGTRIKPVRVPELCQKKVKGFSYSVYDDGAFICAYTADKNLYYWGKYLTLSRFDVTPTLSIMKEFDRTVREVVAGPDHCLILTSDGQIFSFGCNNYGQLGRPTVTLSVPILIEDLKGKFVSKVSSGANFSVAVLDNGEVYAWGDNTDGQLGVGNENQKLEIPNKISALTNVIIQNIICGESYVLAVSEIGELYSWGKNNVGQLGLGDTISRFIPTKVEKIGNVIDVAATCYGSISAAMSENYDVYTWGDCGELNLTEPTETEFDTLFDVFAFVSNPRIMHKPMCRTLQMDSSITDCIKNAFGDSNTSDLTIVADGKEIFVHKIILTLRSDYFKVFLQKQWITEDKKVLIINQNYDGMHAYLQYLYFGHFKGSPEVALETLKIADEYHDLTLKKICEKRVRLGITAENVADLYTLALKLDTKILAKHCVLFACKHIGEMIDTPGFSDWDVNTHKQFIRDCHKQNIYKH